jgi:hypothetical protein
VDVRFSAVLEIFFVGFLVRKLAAIAKAKGRSGWWGGLGVLFWFSGEILGFMIGFMADLGTASYLLALGLAAAGAGAAS